MGGNCLKAANCDFARYFFAFFKKDFCRICLWVFNPTVTIFCVAILLRVATLGDTFDMLKDVKSIL